LSSFAVIRLRTEQEWQFKLIRSHCEPLHY
jgi:hypothetical protein